MKIMPESFEVVIYPFVQCSCGDLMVTALHYERRSGELVVTVAPHTCTESEAQA